MSLVDLSAVLIEQVAVEELDPIQRLRIRNAIKKYGGDQSLLPLADEELDNALGLVMERNGERHPTVAGLLLLGTESLLRQHLPSYEVAFQVLRGTDVQVNEFYRKPLLETFEEVDLQFRPWIIEEEIPLHNQLRLDLFTGGKLPRPMVANLTPGCTIACLPLI